MPKEIARAICVQQADYVLALKENRATLYQDTVDLFAHGQQTPSHRLTTDYVKTTEIGYDCYEIYEF